MTTAIELINQAAGMVGVKAKGQSLGSDDATIYLALLNQYVAYLKDKTGGAFELGTLTSTTPIYLESGDLLCLRYGLAKLIGDDSGFPLSGTAYMTANETEETLLSKYLDNEQVDMPRALIPRGTYLYDIESE